MAALLDGSRAQRAFLLRALLEPPWSIRVEDEAPLTVVAVVRGEASIAHDGGASAALRAGDVAVVRGPEAYVLASSPDVAPQVVVDPEQRCRTVDGEDVAWQGGSAVRTWGNSANGRTTLLVGTYRHEHETSRRLLSVLPPVLVVGADTWSSPLIPYLADEIVRDEPGQEAVLDRLLDLVLIAVLREWLSRPGSTAPDWWRAQADPVVGPAVRCMYGEPARGWTVEALAREAGVSRAVLARRFTELVGQTPMAFLTEWRLALAADLLREPGATLEAVARQVGYGTPFALSAAFKRVRGISPAEHRLLAGAGRARRPRSRPSRARLAAGGAMPSGSPRPPSAPAAR